MKIIFENFGDNVQFKFHTNKFVLYRFTVPVWLLYCVIEIVLPGYLRSRFFHILD